jgi:hypothetical protein
VGDSEFNTKAASQQGDSEEFVPSLCIVGLNPVVARTRVLVHKVSRAEEIAERRLKVSASITPGSRSKSTARGTYLPPEARHSASVLHDSAIYARK